MVAKAIKTTNSQQYDAVNDIPQAVSKNKTKKKKEARLNRNTSVTEKLIVPCQKKKKLNHEQKNTLDFLHLNEVLSLNCYFCEIKI